MVEKSVVAGRLTEHLEPSHLDLVDESDGCGAKYNVFVVSAKFQDLRTLQRHRLVHDALKEEMSNIHALTLKTLTPEEFAKSVND